MVGKLKSLYKCINVKGVTLIFFIDGRWIGKFISVYKMYLYIRIKYLLGVTKINYFFNK